MKYLEFLTESRTAYFQGQRAAREGKSIKDNPYKDYQPVERSLWNTGFKDERKHFVK
jgi:hypothetical protein